MENEIQNNNHGALHIRRDVVFAFLSFLSAYGGSTERQKITLTSAYFASLTNEVSGRLDVKSNQFNDLDHDHQYVLRRVSML